MFSRFGACDSVPAVLVFVKGIGVQSKTALDTVPFTQTSVHYIILKASRANRQIASNDTFLFGAFVV